MTKEQNEKDSPQDQVEAEQAEQGALKKKKVLREEIKDRHTSHWDMDMLSREELEKLLR